MSQEDDLITVLEHYELPEPGYGERAYNCPSHDDAHASASINRSKGVWFCHACGSGGTAAQIVMDREGSLTSRPCITSSFDRKKSSSD